jgi:hypothetical protein
MTFDINIDLVLTVDTFDESEAAIIAERICGYIERDDFEASQAALLKRLAAYERVVEAAEKADYALNAKWPLYEPVRKLGDALAALDRVLEGEEP